MPLDPEFPADDYERDLNEVMSSACDAMEDFGNDWDWPKLKSALLRWVAAQDEGLDSAAVEQEHDE